MHKLLITPEKHNYTELCEVLSIPFLWESISQERSEDRHITVYQIPINIDGGIKVCPDESGVALIRS